MASDQLNAQDRAALDAMYGSQPAPVFAAPQTAQGPDPYLEAVKRFEGYSAKPYWDYKQYTSGYGTRAASPNEVLDPQTANARLQDEWYKAAQTVDKINPNLDPGTRAALTSLTFNAGPGWANQSLGQKIAAGDIEGAKPIFLSYNRAGGQPLPALINRRQEEAGWFGGNAPPAPSGAPTALAAPTAAPASSSASAAAPGGLGSLLARLVGAQPTLAPAAGVLGIPGQPPQGAPASPASALSAYQAYQPEPPPPLQMPPFDQLQFANQQPLRLARPQVKFGRGFY